MRAGPGPGLSLDTRCPLPRYVLGLRIRSRGSDSAARAGLRETTWLCPRWAHEAGGALSRAVAAKERSPRYRPDLNKPRPGSARRWEAISGTDSHRTGGETVQLPHGSRHCLAPRPACLLFSDRALGCPSPQAERSRRWGPTVLHCGRGTSQHTCDIQPSCGQSWERQRTVRIPQETAGTYHAQFIIETLSVYLVLAKYIIKKGLGTRIFTRHEEIPPIAQ